MQVTPLKPHLQHGHLVLVKRKVSYMSSYIFLTWEGHANEKQIDHLKIEFFNGKTPSNNCSLGYEGHVEHTICWLVAWISNVVCVSNFFSFVKFSFIYKHLIILKKGPPSFFYCIFSRRLICGSLISQIQNFSK